MPSNSKHPDGGGRSDDSNAGRRYNPPGGASGSNSNNGDKRNVHSSSTVRSDNHASEKPLPKFVLVTSTTNNGNTNGNGGAHNSAQSGGSRRHDRSDVADHYHSSSSRRDDYQHHRDGDHHRDDRHREERRRDDRRDHHHQQHHHQPRTCGDASEPAPSTYRCPVCNRLGHHWIVQCPSLWTDNGAVAYPHVHLRTGCRECGSREHTHLRACPNRAPPPCGSCGSVHLPPAGDAAGAPPPPACPFQRRPSTWHEFFDRKHRVVYFVDANAYAPGAAPPPLLPAPVAVAALGGGGGAAGQKLRALQQELEARIALEQRVAADAQRAARVHGGYDDDSGSGRGAAEQIAVAKALAALPQDRSIPVLQAEVALQAQIVSAEGGSAVSTSTSKKASGIVRSDITFVPPQHPQDVVLWHCAACAALIPASRFPTACPGCNQSRWHELLSSGSDDNDNGRRGGDSHQQPRSDHRGQR